MICVLQTDEPQEYVIKWPEFFNRRLLKPTVREAGQKKVLVHGRLKRIVGVFKWALIASFSNHDGNAKENVIWKSKFAELWLFCDYPITFKFYDVGEARFNWTARSAVQENTDE